MNPVDRQTLARKLEYLRKQLETLEPYRSLPQEVLRDKVEKRLAVERLLELCIQSIIDISRLLASLEDLRNMGDERDALLLLADRVERYSVSAVGVPLVGRLTPALLQNVDACLREALGL